MASCGLPAGIGRAALERLRRSPGGLPLDLAPGGVCRAARVTPGAGALLPHRFTLTGASPESGGPAVCSLWHFPAGHPGSVLPITLPCGARTFLDSWGLPRPSGRLVPTAGYAVGAGVTNAAEGAAAHVVNEER